ncbi:MAG TPA: hypothetical protein ENG98_04020 [Actinobacteria bacterium]|nr:hypothetical protein [Actinomycetota bacterium]
MNKSHHSMLSVAAVLVIISAGCGTDKPAVADERPLPVIDVAVTVALEDPAVIGASNSSRSYEATLVVQLTFEDSVRSSPLVTIGEIVSVGDVGVANGAGAERSNVVVDEMSNEQRPHDFQVLTVRVTEILRDDGTGADTLGVGTLVAVALPNRTSSTFVPKTIGPLDTVGLRILISGRYRVVGYDDGVPKKMVLARPSATYVELPSISGESARGVRLWTPYSDRRTPASRGELSETVLDAMQYTDAPEFSDLLARIPGAETRPREQHLGYDQVTRTTLPQPPPGNEP